MVQAHVLLLRMFFGVAQNFLIVAQLRNESALSLIALINLVSESSSVFAAGVIIFNQSLL